MGKLYDIAVNKGSSFCSKFVSWFCGGIFFLLLLLLLVRLGFPGALGYLTVSVLLTLLLSFGARRWEKRKTSKVRGELFLFCWYFILGVLWVLCARSSIPQGDQASVFQIAGNFAAGNYAAVEPDGYLSSYPQQLGIIAFYEVFLRLFHWFSNILARFGTTDLYTAQYVTLYLIQAGLTALYAVFGLRVTKFLFPNPKVHFIYVCMMAGCAPLFLYMLFLYGDVLSFCFLLGGTWAFLRFLDTEKWSWGLPALVLITCSVLARKTSLIFVIACVIVLLLHGAAVREWRFIFFAVTATVLAVSILPLTIHFYEQKSGQKLSGQVPSVAWVAMGLQESPSGYGTNNAFNINTHLSSHYDTQKTAQVSKESIRASLDRFRTDPGYGIYFFYQKISHEWTDSDFEGFILTDNYSTATTVQKLVYENPMTHGLLTAYMNCHKLMVYFGMVWCMWGIACSKERREVGILLFPITIIGGFLFYIAWESSCRYVLPFFLMAIPYASGGLAQVGERMNKAAKRYIKLDARLNQNNEK
jgi:hypothetical protein